ncbi:MAG: hypothetical protein ACRYG5_06205 [Janthinobacterium lividum]
MTDIKLSPIAAAAHGLSIEPPTPTGATGRQKVYASSAESSHALAPADASAMLLSVLSAQTRGLHLDLTSAEINIQALQERIATQSRDIIRKIDEAAQARADAQSASRVSFWMNIAADVVAIGFAALLVVASGGTAAPLAALAVASLSAGYAAADIGVMTYGAATGKDMDLASLVASGVSEMCVKVFNCTKELADQIGMWVSLLLPIVLSLGEMGVAMAPKMAATTAAKFPRLAKVLGQRGVDGNLGKLTAMSSNVSKGATVVDAGVSIANGAASGTGSYFSNVADNADIDRQKTDARRTVSRVEHEQLFDHIKSALGSIASNRDSVTSMLKDAHKMRLQTMAA